MPVDSAVCWLHNEQRLSWSVAHHPSYCNKRGQRVKRRGVTNQLMIEPSHWLPVKKTLPGSLAVIKKSAGSNPKTPSPKLDLLD
jgi:hypothetical protein